MWIAVYNDGTLLPQFEENKEHLFSEIDHSKLITFRIGLDRIYSVDLTDGSFHIGGASFKFEGFDGQKFSLVYFRRVRQTLGGGSGPVVTHHMGWQTKVSPDGLNQQRIMTIRENDLEVGFQVK